MMKQLKQNKQGTCSERVNKSTLRVDKPSAFDSLRVKEEGNHFEVALNCPYVELDETSSDGILDCLPPPCKFSRFRMKSSAPLENCCCQGAMISLLKPHKIIAASAEFLRTVGFTSDQIRSRTIRALVGPNTDMSELSAAIKNAGHMHSTQINTTLYTSCGTELEVTATLSPHVNVLSGSLGGCVLRIDSVRDGAGTSCPAFFLEDFGGACP